MSIKKSFFLIFLPAFLIFFTTISFAAQIAPLNLFNIGDSIGEAEAVDNVIGSRNHKKVWSTGFDTSDIIYSFNERFSDLCPNSFQTNNASLDQYFNQAESGAVMSDFTFQAENVVEKVSYTSSGKADMITVYLGNNDVCSDSLGSMTPATDFENSFRAGLDILANSIETRMAYIHVSAIPDIYWLWVALRENQWCLTAWSFVPCRNLLGTPVNDCGDGDSYLHPDTIQTDDGPNCIRRKKVHAMIKNTYNPILQRLVLEYAQNNRLPHAYFSDIFETRFLAEHINTGDCFHPSVAGQQLLARQQWKNTPWYSMSPICSEQNVRSISPWLHLLLSQ